MTFAQALAYFFREATVSLLRSWKVSLLAVLTIAVSLFIGGAFFLVGSNLAGLAEEWRGEARVVVYLEPEVESEAERDSVGEAEGETGAGAGAVLTSVAAQPWAQRVTEVAPEEAAERFRASFPSLADLLQSDGAAALPASIEVLLTPAADPVAVSAWAEEMRLAPGVDMVDDDRDWLRQLEALIAVVRGAGLLLGAVLLAAAIFTIASVIRLTAYLYHEEIAVMRLVGATEFYIRGPFYVEGLLQGLLGGLLALGGLYGGYQALLRQDIATGLLSRVLAPGFFSAREAAMLVLAGGAAGLLGSLLSLRREKLDEVAEVGQSDT